MPLTTSPNATWMPASASHAAGSNRSRMPSGSQAQALDSSRGRKTGSAPAAVCAAMWLIARSSRVMLSTAIASLLVQHTTPTWCWRSR